ncbi:ABC transporter substrate-binding protein [Clostridium sp.]|jgi:raffinose/stachyose/melibiose transport system substrate-binding protein|uniref:ABC transporter substrate-binding protein n=1 Tax=Clostridium sp. TaxID=1506 RepID=UPI003EEADF52
MKKKSKSIHNLYSVLVILIMVFSLSSCKKEKIEEQKKLNIYMDTTDEYSSNVIKFLIDDFKKNNSDVEIKFNDVLGGKSNILDTINKGTEIDLIFTNRNTIIELSKKGVLSDLEDVYEQLTLKDRYYDIMSSYGRVGDIHYGLGVIPYSIELLYNKEYLRKLNISNPNNLDQWLDVLKKVNGKGIKTPVVLTEDVDANGFLFSLLASKAININDLEENYDGGEKCYKKLKAMQAIFNEFNSLTKNNGINLNSFEVSNEQSIDGFNNGDSPLLVGISYYNSKLTGSNIGIIEDYDNNSNYGSNIPIIINSLLGIPVNAKNLDTVKDFIKYIYSDEVQGRIVQSGIISGNKVANEKITGIGKIMVRHMYKANDNSILILYNLPDKIKKSVILATKRILSGKFSTSEWNEILKECYK